MKYVSTALLVYKIHRLCAKLNKKSVQSTFLRKKFTILLQNEKYK